MGKKPVDEISDTEAEQRANAAMRRALSTPYKPQSEMKTGRKKKARRVRRDRSASNHE
jgi:hypothetical protein